MKKKFAIFSFFSIFSLFLYSQNEDNISYSLYVGDGYVVPTNDFVKKGNKDSVAINHMISISFRIAKQVDGTKAWHHLYNEFTYGVGGYYGRFNYSKNLINPFALYGFIGFSPLKTERFALKTNLALGLSFWWNGYSKENNLNVAISNPINCYIDAGLDGYYRLNDNFQVFAGVSYTHFSNGAIVKPNKGINVISPRIGLSYNPQKIVFKQAMDSLNFQPKWENIISVYGGWHSVYKTFKYTPDNNSNEIKDTARKSYFVYGIQGRLMRELNYKYSLGLGVDLSYNSSIGYTSNQSHYSGYKNELSSWDKTTISTFLAYEYKINKLSILLEPGVYLKIDDENTESPKYYQRIGLRQQINENYFCQVALRAYKLHIADYIEWTLGYRIKKNNK